jgi:hypothetical protein
MATPLFTQFDLLDPVSLGNKLATAHGSAVFDNQSLLDPARMEAQINALSSTPPFNKYRGINDTTWTPITLATAIGSI